MAIIIDNKVKSGEMLWNGGSLQKYNGVDVDSIYNSKRHKKTGKMINPAELRNWISKYITKYVSKNNESFTHLCWHCSRSISRLFTSTVYNDNEKRLVTDFLPTDNTNYICYESDFNLTKIFKFVPAQIIYDKIRAYNNYVFSFFEFQFINNNSKLTFKSTVL